MSQFGSLTSINSESNESSLPMKGRQSIDQSIIQIDKEAVEAKRSEEEQKTSKRQIIKEVTTLQFSRTVYWIYFKIGMAGWKGLFCPVLLTSFLGAQVIFTYSDYYLALFTNSEEKRHEENIGGRNMTSFVDNLSREQNITIYSTLMAILFALSLLRALLFFKVSSSRACKGSYRTFRLTKKKKHAIHRVVCIRVFVYTIGCSGRWLLPRFRSLRRTRSACFSIECHEIPESSMRYCPEGCST